MHVLQEERDDTGSSSNMLCGYVCGVHHGTGSTASLQPHERPLLQSASPAAILTDGSGIKGLRALNACCCQSHLSFSGTHLTMSLSFYTVQGPLVLIPGQTLDHLSSLKHLHSLALNTPSALLSDITS